MDLAIPIIFPAYRITVVENDVEIDLLPGWAWDDVTIPKTKVDNLGHAGVLLIRGSDGLTKYYEYGRYDPASHGITRRVTIPDVVIGADGRPTMDSLANVMDSLSRKSGQNGRVAGVLVDVPGGFDRMHAEAKRRVGQNSDASRDSYGLLTNSCLHFSIAIVEAGGPNLPAVIDPRPSGYLARLRSAYLDVDYDPRTQTLTIESAGAHVR